MKKLIAAILIASAMSAQAESGWVEVQKGYFVDVNSVKINNEKATLWTKRTEELATLKKIDKTITLAMTHHWVDCEKRSSRYLGGYAYNKLGELRYSESGRYEYEQLIPDTWHYVRTEFVCNYVANKAQGE